MPPTIGAELVFYQHTSVNQSLRIGASSPRLKQRILKILRRHSLIRRVRGALSRPKIEHCPFGVDPYVAQARHFVELIRTERLGSNMNTIDSSLAALEIIEIAKTVGRLGP